MLAVPFQGSVNDSPKSNGMIKLPKLFYHRLSLAYLPSYSMEILVRVPIQKCFKVLLYCIKISMINNNNEHFGLLSRKRTAIHYRN